MVAHLIAVAWVLTTPPRPSAGPDGSAVDGVIPRVAEPVRLNDDGGWCWFEDPRALIHRGRMVVGSVAAGRHDPRRRGDIEVAVYEPATGAVERVELHDRLELDDHDSPALLATTDGRLLAVYARHGREACFYYRRSEPGDLTRWGPIGRFSPGPTSRLTYANLFRLSAEGDRVYDFFRGLDGRMKPSFATSDDGGRTWRRGAVAIDSLAVRPYVRYASDGREAIHLIYTEGHPRDADNSLYHAVYRRGMLHRSDGSPIGPLAEGLRTPEQGTCLFRGDADHVAWPVDVELDGRGRLRVAYSVQVGGAGLPPGRGGGDLRYRYARWDGQCWHDHALARAGTSLYAGEDDYSGLVALDPDRPDVAYISTNADPVSGAPLVSAADRRRHHEIFRGITADDGASWSWTSITRDSTEDNLRPIIPPRDGGWTMLLWLRGTYRAFTDYDLEVVGLRLE